MFLANALSQIFIVKCFTKSLLKNNYIWIKFTARASSRSMA